MPKAQDFFLDTPTADARQLKLVTAESLAAWLTTASASQAAWVKASGFRARADTVVAVPGDDGQMAVVLAGLGEQAPGLRGVAAVAAMLPSGDYVLAGKFERPEILALGWAIGQYRFDRYRAADPGVRRLAWPGGVDRASVLSAATADFLVRDLVNTPASDMGPAELETAALALAGEFGAEWRIVNGSALLEQNLPAIHAVGRASAREPRLIDLQWGDPVRPRLTLVGKGVCFDSGGLNIKPPAGMRHMKKDMGGAAHVLGLARMIMAADLPVRLRVLIPAVENSIDGNAYRPGDVITTRKGLTVEIGNTDAEGRMVLCDALALAGEESPDLIIDMATLTGAARVALGPELPAMFCSDDGMATRLQAKSALTEDPLWHMPLWAPYDQDLTSAIADLNHIASNAFAGSIYGALFLQRFVDATTAWLHLDVYAWNAKTRAGRPEGGEMQSVRALFALLEERYRD
ncbi:MAG: leucyl aminopeptidase family protein [Gammaproteobacteria bacterium]